MHSDTGRLHALDDIVRPVGWLSSGEDYPRGPVERDVFAKLQQLCSARSPLRLPVTAGYHECELCQFEPARMKDEIFVPGSQCIFFAPRGIIHYVAQHWYQPPAEFLEAVMACPPMDSMDYKKAFLANGGREILRAWGTPPKAQ